MYYVEDGGKFKDTEEKIDIGDLFFDNKSQFNYSMLYPIVGNFSLLHQAINHILESTYMIYIERISRTEKNKGREYNSSSFTVTAGLEKYNKTSAESKKDLTILIEFLFTLRGSSINFLEIISQKNSKFIREWFPYTEDKFECLEKDISLYQKIQKGDFVFMFTPIKILYQRQTKFELDPMDQAIYLGYITKFMEMYGNYMLENERIYYSNQYELWLFSLFRKYFVYELIKNFEEWS